MAAGLAGSIHPTHCTEKDVVRLNPAVAGVAEQIPPLGGETICTVRDAVALTEDPVSITVRVKVRGPAPSNAPSTPSVISLGVPRLFAGRDRSSPTTSHDQ